MTELPVLKAKDFKSDQEVRWCPGCGDYAILAAVQGFLPELGVPRERLVFISGIGCARALSLLRERIRAALDPRPGRRDRDGARGLAPGPLGLGRLGDGDALSIGGNHFLHALRRNVNITILLFNNQVYGLTKGQYSPTEPARPGDRPDADGLRSTGRSTRSRSRSGRRRRSSRAPSTRTART